MQRKVSFTLAILVVLLPSQAPATTVPRLDLSGLVHSSQLIVRAHVVRHWFAWDQAHQFIWSHYLLDVEDALKGQHFANLVASEPGGASGGMIMRVEGVPEYRDGEEVVVFLQRTPIGYWRCAGWGQGKYTVITTAAGTKRIRSNFLGLVFPDRSSAAGVKRPGAKLSLDTLNGITLDEFKRLVVREANR